LEKIFYRYPETIAACGTNKFFFRYEDEDDICVEKVQTNGNHREYFSFCFIS
jgi:hypothetical protein